MRSQHEPGSQLDPGEPGGASISQEGQGELSRARRELSLLVGYLPQGGELQFGGVLIIIVLASGWRLEFFRGILEEGGELYFLVGSQGGELQFFNGALAPARRVEFFRSRELHFLAGYLPQGCESLVLWFGQGGRPPLDPGSL